jgi:hypothetical protein
LSWSRQFDEPIKLPKGGTLQTLRDVGEYVAALPKVEHDKAHWLTAAHELMMAAERGGIVMMAEIAMRQALAHRRPKLAPEPRKKATKKYRIVK